ncbi:IclR family transcriptional regulator [Virgibacillus natechei]
MSENKYVVPSVVTTIKILEYLGRDEIVSVNIDDLSNKLNVSKSTCYRILVTLRIHDLIEYDEAKRLYSIGPMVALLGNSAMKKNNYLNVFQSYLNNLTKKTKCTFILTKKTNNNKLAYILKSEPNESISINVKVGTKFPIVAGAHGKCYLAHMDENKRKKMYKNELTAFTDKTIMDIEKIEEEIVTIKEKGYAISEDEHISGLSGVSSPILKSDFTVDMTLSCIFFSSTFSREKTIELGKMIYKTATEMSKIIY